MTPDPEMHLRFVLLVFAGILGAIMGSFLNAFIYRWPLRISMWKRKRSFCPACKHDLAWYDNIPILSYLMLLGRCRYCKARIHPRYLIVEVLTAGLFLLVFYQEAVLNYGTLSSWHAPYFSYPKIALHLALVAALVGIAFVDCLVTRIPNEITIPGVIIAPIVSVIWPELHAEMFRITGMLRLDALLNSLAGILISGGLLWLLGLVGEAMLKKPAMGFGDVKMMALVGGLLGFPTALLAIAFSAVLGAVVGAINLLVTGSHRIPFGPFLAIGTTFTMLWGPQMVYMYMAWVMGDAPPPPFHAVFFPHF